MFIPLTHEEGSVRTVPWVSIVIVVLCLVTFFFVRSGLDAVETSDRAYMDAFLYYLEHPHLDPDPRLVSATGAEQVRLELGRTPAAGSVRALEERQLAELTDTWLASLPDNPLWRLGLVPSEIRPLGALAYMFTHADWGHLLGNLLFFYLTAPFIEDRFGRRLFIPFYLAAGLVSGFAFCLHYPDLGMPLIGASGAVAGTLGAFLVLFGTTRIRLLTFIFIIPKTFNAPAWLVIPLWFLTDLSMAVEGSRTDPSGLLGGVAYWAHVWGFLVGVAAAVAFRMSGRGDAAADGDDALASPEVLPRAAAAALEARRKGRPEEAWQMLRDEVRRSPDLPLVADHFWHLSLELGRTREAAPLADHRIRALLREGDWEAAWQLWQELEGVDPRRAHRPPLTLPLAEALLARGHDRDGESLLGMAAEAAGPATPVGVLVKLYHLAGRRDEALRRRVAAVLREHPQAPPELRSQVDGELYVPG